MIRMFVAEISRPSIAGHSLTKSTVFMRSHTARGFGLSQPNSHSVSYCSLHSHAFVTGSGLT